MSISIKLATERAVHVLLQGVYATRIAALVWGRDDDGGGLTFKQRDIDKLVEVAANLVLCVCFQEAFSRFAYNIDCMEQVADHRGSAAMWFPMKEDYGQAILSLCAKNATLFSAFPKHMFVPSLSW